MEQENPTNFDLLDIYNSTKTKSQAFIPASYSMSLARKRKPCEFDGNELEPPHLTKTSIRFSEMFYISLRDKKGGTTTSYSDTRDRNINFCNSHLGFKGFAAWARTRNS